MIRRDRLRPLLARRLRSARHGRRWSIFLVVVLGLACVGLTLFFRDVEVKALTAQNQLVVVSEQVNAQDALEWRAISGLVEVDEVVDGLSAPRSRTGAAIDAAQEFGLSDARSATLRRLAAEYSSAVDTELSLIADGREDEAQEFDEQTVDPAYDALGPELGAAAADLSHGEKRAGRINIAGVIGTVALALTAVLVLDRRRQKSQADRVAQARYRALVDRSGDFVLVAGPQEQLLYASPAARHAGLAVSQVRLVDLVHPDDQQAAAALTAADDQDRTTAAELRLRHVDLGWRTCETSLTTLHDGDVKEVVIVAHDVTERVQAQEAAVAAREQALESSRLKSEFLATMSHEIRTPMNGVIGLTSLLVTTELDGVQRQYVEGIKGAGEALMVVINDILDFSKLEAGKVELDDVDFDSRLLVDDVARLLAPSAYVKHLELLAFCRPDVPHTLRGDGGRIRQILLNLASNAVKFTDSGEISIEVSSKPLTDEQVLIRFEVKDTGIGISPKDQRRLFQSFSQADASTTRRYGGTGLGLAIALRLTEAMGGQIGLDSEVKVGSTFWVEIPLAAARRSVPAHEAQGSMTGSRVIVVDDSVATGRYLELLLAAWHLEADHVTDASTALARMTAMNLAHRPYHLAIIDMDMPGISGLELTRHIRDNPALRATRILMMVSTLQADTEPLDEVGVSDWIAKPVRSSEVYDRLLTMTSPKPDMARAVPTVPAGVVETGKLGRILVVEDNKLNQLVAEGIVTRLGYQVDIVANGLEALEAVSVTTYSAILMDCHMPLMDGFEATRELRRNADEGSPRIPIIAMTAGAMTEDRERCLAAGMDD